MEKLYQTYKDVAEINIVYISEAHAADDSWPVPYAKDKGIKEHTNYGERCAVAERLVKDKKLTIPCLIDKMDNKVADAYKGWPDRIYLIRKDGRLGVAGNRGPWGFPPALAKVTQWLEEYKKTGEEPVLPEQTPKDDSGRDKKSASGDRPGGDAHRVTCVGCSERIDASKAYTCANHCHWCERCARRNGLVCSHCDGEPLWRRGEKTN